MKLTTLALLIALTKQESVRVPNGLNRDERRAWAIDYRKKECVK